jgi:two-component system, chemotaxis family, protein-glutamate methylesterase/glutaminase
MRKRKSRTPSQKHDIFVVGASMGGVTALQKLLGGLPKNFRGAVFIVLHLSSKMKSRLAELLAKSCLLPVEWATEGAVIQSGHVYVAVPDYHLVINEGRLSLSHAAKNNRHRPAVNVLFESAAKVYGPRVVGTVLTGSLDCGTEGLRVIKQNGGKAIVQDPKDAEVPDMPVSALESVEIDYCVRLSDMPDLFLKLSKTTVGELPKVPAPSKTVPSGLVCPECSGPMWEARSSNLSSFACRVGHTYSLKSLYESKSETAEAHLWRSQETLLEQAKLARRLYERAQALSQQHEAYRFLTEARIAENAAEVLKGVLNETIPKLNGKSARELHEDQVKSA